ncbi:MAG TPA: DNA repair protein RecO [Elusimicrobia bacterium]|nr:DNA repair protein RecO [Elusimicrobiota bacterium]HBT62272.1 DNA repair protein RecO [Elusimicrobiota bacterium]
MPRPDPIRNDAAVVLWRRDLGERDRWAWLLTENHGKLSVRFGGVNRPTGKLKALSEPLVWGEYRLCFSARAPAARVIGGRIQSSFPGLRGDLARTLQALSICEMVLRLTPERSPSPEKYRLLCRALCMLDQGPSPWLEAAFGLRLLESAGFGLRDLPVWPAQRELWRFLHETPLEALGLLPWSEEPAARILQLVYDHVEAHAERPLRCRRVAASLRLRAAQIEQRETIPC